MRQTIARSQFAALTRRTGVRLTPRSRAKAYKAYGALLRMLQRVHAPLPAGAAPAHRFDAGAAW